MLRTPRAFNRTIAISSHELRRVRVWLAALGNTETMQIACGDLCGEFVRAAPRSVITVMTWHDVLDLTMLFSLATCYIVTVALSSEAIESE